MASIGWRRSNAASTSGGRGVGALDIPVLPIQWRFVCALTFEVSGPEPGWRLARETDDDLNWLAGQGPCRWRSARPKG